MSTFDCSICNITLSDGSGAKSHFAGKKHLLNTKRLKALQQASECSIFVTGFPYGTSELQLADYFSRFGPLESINVNKEKGTYAFVCFTSRQVTECVLSRNIHIFCGRRLVVKPRQMKEFKPTVKEEPCAIDHEKIIKKLQSCSSVDEQILALNQLLPLGRNDFAEREELCAYLEQVLQEFFPTCKLYLFGSTVNGYGLKGCDVDIAVSLCEEEQGNEPVMATGLRDPTDVPSINDLRMNKQLWRHLLNMNVNAQLKFVQKVLKKIAQGCRRVILIPSSRCPIVRFQYKQLSCDISIGKRLVLYNTRLLWLYGKLDHRVKILGIMLRYWAKMCNLLGPKSSLTSYAFTLMIIFFLQTRSPPVIPSVEELMHLAGASEKRSVGGWDCSFCEDVSKIPFYQNTKLPEELMKEFFCFYSSFDFTLHVICPRNASTILKISSDIVGKKFKSAPICIQDPFDLSHNITGNVNNSFLIFLTENFQYALKTCQTSNFCTRLNNACWGICRLLESPVKFENKHHSFQKSTITSYFEIPLKTGMLHALYDELPEGSISNVKRSWLKKTCETVQNVFEKGLLFECHITECHLEERKIQRKRSPNVFEEEEKQQIKHMKYDESCYKFSLESDQSSDVKSKERTFPAAGCSDTSQKTDIRGNTCLGESSILHYGKLESNCDANEQTLLRKINCKVFNRTWVGRNSIRKGILMTDSSNLLKKENSVSQIILNQSGCNTELPLFEYDCLFREQYHGGLTGLTVTIEPKNQVNTKSKEISVLINFLRSYVPKIVEQLMSEMPNSK